MWLNSRNDLKLVNFGVRMIGYASAVTIVSYALLFLKKNRLCSVNFLSQPTFVHTTLN